MTIIEISLVKAQSGERWTIADHLRLVNHIREVEASWRRMLDAQNGMNCRIRRPA